MNIEKNRVVSLHYTLTSTEGEILDKSEEGRPLDYLHGSGNLIPGLESALEGKKAGDSFAVTVPPEQGYGVYDDGLVMNLAKSKFDTAEEVKEGMEFAGETEDGEYHVFRVVSVKGEKVKVDGNHPLAGRKLNFQILVENVREATEEEMSHGHVHGADDCDCECGDGGCGGGCCG